MNKYSLITAGLVAAGVASSASAQTVVRITGSTAYRANVNAVLLAGTGIFDHAPTVIGAAYSAGASQLVFSNTISGSPVLIKTSFTGSEAGIASLVNVAVPNNVSGQPNANLPGTPKPTFLDNTGTTANDVSSPDIAMADTSQAVSLTQAPGIADKGIVGVVQFVWMKGKNNGQANWAHLSNVTIPQLNVLLAAGQQDLSFITGATADVGTPVAVFGRNKGSGTRVNTLIEALYGVGKAVKQYAVSPTYTAGVLNRPPATTPINDAAITLISNDGYDSGGGVANTMLMTAGGGTLTTIPIGYLGLNDANSVQALVGTGTGTAAPTGGQYLTLNGVNYSDQAISNGAYDFWGHEHILTGPFTSATGQTVASALVSKVAASAAGGTSGYPYIPYNGSNPTTATMFADRPAGGDSGFVSPL